MIYFYFTIKNTCGKQKIKTTIVIMLYYITHICCGEENMSRKFVSALGIFLESTERPMLQHRNNLIPDGGIADGT
ncbi:hypothetical protein PWYN_13755 [Paenibacillus wynnii]|uniref:Uncharacterized protein n=1 Tax=Paenibacillus wynnii TaxID=268407 RepID=A0A098MCJ9_9BACL|nr:hypothetical protein PWYN_13755 [Paenibacillus wynnii]